VSNETFSIAFSPRRLETMAAGRMSRISDADWCDLG
jgi:hypothetical protein